MNPSELVEYQKSIEKYIQDAKLTDFFENLTRLLILSKPKDPYTFIIEVLEHRLVQRLILVQGLITPKRNEIVAAIGHSFNYKVITIEEILEEQIKQSKFRDPNWLNDQVVNDAVFDALKKTEKHHRGVILSGYPNNLQQSLFLQQKGIIPERFFLLYNMEDFCRQYYQSLYEHSLREQNIILTQQELDDFVQQALTRDRLNRRDLDLTYGCILKFRIKYQEYIDEFDLSKRPKEDVVDNLKQILKLRDKKQPPLRTPRVMIIRPPKLKERAQYLLDTFSRRYGLVSIQTSELIERQIKEKTTIGMYLQNCLNQGNQIPNDIIQSIIYTQVQSTAAKTKGWILEGFPKNIAQLNSVSSYNFSPNLILVLTEDDDILFNKIKQLKVDPLTKKKYESIAPQDKELIKRIRNFDVKNENLLRQDLFQYQEFIRKVEEIHGDRVQLFKIEKDSLENIIRITDVFLNNPKIYN